MILPISVLDISWYAVKLGRRSRSTHSSNDALTLNAHCALRYSGRHACSSATSPDPHHRQARRQWCWELGEVSKLLLDVVDCGLLLARKGLVCSEVGTPALKSAYVNVSKSPVAGRCTWRLTGDFEAHRTLRHFTGVCRGGRRCVFVVMLAERRVKVEAHFARRMPIRRPPKHVPLSTQRPLTAWTKQYESRQ